MNITFAEESDDVGVIADVMNCIREYGVRIGTTDGREHVGAITGATWDFGVGLRDQWGNETTVPIDRIDTVEIT